VEIRQIFEIFKSINWICSGSLGSLEAWSFPEENDGLEIRPIFLASEPELAAGYCGRATAGGEVSGMVRCSIRDLRAFLRKRETKVESLRDQLEDYEQGRERGMRARVVEVCAPWLRNAIHRLTPLEARLKSLREGKHTGIVYAFRFGQSDVDSLRGSNCTYITEKAVSPEKIVAKARIVGGQCGHLERFPFRYYRDSEIPSTLIGAIMSKKMVPDREQAVTPVQSEWDRAVICPDAGVDLAQKYDRDGLLFYLRAKYPEVFSDVELCREYGW